MIEVSREERVYYLLQLSALYAVFVPKLHGAPTKCHQVTTVVVCFFFFLLNYSQECFLKRAISAPRLCLTLGLHAHTPRAYERTRTHAKHTHKTQFGEVACLSTCANQSVESNLSGNL